MSVSAFDIGRLLYEARIREAWGRGAERRLSDLPWPRHEADERSAEHDLAIAQAKKLLATHDITPRRA